MTIREEYEYLKTELMVNLTDATPVSELAFPFNYTISKEDESRFFMKGTTTRLAAKKAIIILDNTYKKVRLFPSSDIADTYREVQEDILADLKKEVLNAFHEDAWRFENETEENFIEFLDKLTDGLRKASEPFIKKLQELTQEDIEKEIAEKDNLKKAEKGKTIKSNTDDKKRGLF